MAVHIRFQRIMTVYLQLCRLYPAPLSCLKTHRYRGPLPGSNNMAPDSDSSRSEDRVKRMKYAGATDSEFVDQVMDNIGKTPLYLDNCPPDNDILQRYTSCLTSGPY